MEELALQVGHLIPFIWLGWEGYFKGSPMIQYTHLACLKVDLWFVFAINGLFLCFTEWKRIQIPDKYLRWIFL